MRRHLFIAMMMLSMSICSIVGSAQGVDSRATNEYFTTVYPHSEIIHQGETITSFVTVQNLFGGNQEFTLSLVSAPPTLNITNLPVSSTLVQNHLKQLTFQLTANESAPFGDTQIILQLTTDLDENQVDIIQINITIAPYSNLNFGSNEVTTLIVDEKIRVPIAVNITNNATMADNVTFQVYSTSGWNWGWTMQNTLGQDAYLTLQPDSLAYVYLWVDIPAIINGYPEFETGPRFQLNAISGLDRAVETWNFDLLMNEHRNMTIDTPSSSIILAPGEDGRVPVTIRNVGNFPNKLNLTLLGLSVNGIEMNDLQSSDRFNLSGWTVALFGGLEDVLLGVNQTRTIEIGIQAPLEYNGSLTVEFIAFPGGNPAVTRTIEVQATIQRERSSEVTLISNSCDSVLPNATCLSQVQVKNLGNAHATYTLRMAKQAELVETTLPNSPLWIDAGGTKLFPTISMIANENAIAFANEKVRVEVLDDTFNVVAELEIPVVIGPFIHWTFSDITSEIDGKGRMSISMVARNDGNAIDGLMVQLQSSHSTSMGFIPPFIAIVEEGVEHPRSFEVQDIPLGQNFTIRAWIDLPTDQIVNGTIYVNTTIRSQFAPDTPFTSTVTGEYLGIEWQPGQATDDGFEFAELVSLGWAYLKAWFWILMAIMFSCVIVYKAVLDRDERLRNDSILPYQQSAQEQPEDWMSKFNTKTDDPQTGLMHEAQPIPADAFSTLFRARAGETTPSAVPVQQDLREAASLVLDVNTNQQSKSKADEMLHLLRTTSPETKHPLNDVLTKTKAVNEHKANHMAPDMSGYLDDLEF